MVKVVVLKQRISETEYDSAPKGTVQYLEYAIIYGSEEFNCLFGGINIVSYANGPDNKPRETNRDLLEKEKMIKIFKALIGGD